MYLVCQSVNCQSFAGVEKLKEVYQNRPNFADQEAQEDTRQKLIGVSAHANLGVVRILDDSITATTMCDVISLH